MRLPWGNLSMVIASCGAGKQFAVLGSLSSEERCVSVPRHIQSLAPRSSIRLLDIHDPPDAFPDYSVQTRQRVATHKDLLTRDRVSFSEETCSLLLSEDDLLDIYSRWKNELVS